MKNFVGQLIMEVIVTVLKGLISFSISNLELIGAKFDFQIILVSHIRRARTQKCQPGAGRAAVAPGDRAGAFLTHSFLCYTTSLAQPF